ncbi:MULTISPECIES: M24 family metallopeptidase [Prosthecochloris]|uniref:Aminopeptidase P family protein n=1 Tax=Prosthecochloris vibrioformis TaxID=1098 RepID=A0A5C4S276_PROVB|nr:MULTISPECIES: aminopeptidase P family protein [Prosthecochloris]ANT64367.1 Xaa-Pro dipeptidase [Prosthecochloris sp. CIB 2401]TNJ37222.1 aminopeptidase P family protein [Prosthecochloris vibrioformis]
MQQFHSGRLDSVRRKMADDSIPALYVSDLHAIRWLSGFTGSSARLLVGKERAELYTDFRYREQAQEEVQGCSVHIVSSGFPGSVASSVASLGGELFVQSESITFDEVTRLEAVEGITRVSGARNLLGGLRMLKDAAEHDALRRAAQVSEKVFEEVLGLVTPGITEQELAAEISCRHRRYGAEGDSFDPIVASGAHAALPHARPRPVRLEWNSLLVIDMGCMVGGYASDMTRTVALGTLPDEAEAMYAIVRDAQQLGLDSAVAGMQARELDAVVRSFIEGHGYGDAFGHSLGHGVGLEVHEFPRISSQSEDVLQPGMVFTIEPGIYLPGMYGVRIEDTVILHPDGPEPLQQFPKKLVRV